jgi:hypothetical protein
MNLGNLAIIWAQCRAFYTTNIFQWPWKISYLPIWHGGRPAYQLYQIKSRSNDTQQTSLLTDRLVGFQNHEEEKKNFTSCLVEIPSIFVQRLMILNISILNKSVSKFSLLRCCGCICRLKLRMNSRPGLICESLTVVSRWLGSGELQVKR